MVLAKLSEGNLRALQASGFEKNVETLKNVAGQHNIKLTDGSTEIKFHPSKGAVFIIDEKKS